MCFFGFVKYEKIKNSLLIMTITYLFASKIIKIY